MAATATKAATRKTIELTASYRKPRSRLKKRRQKARLLWRPLKLLMKRRKRSRRRRRVNRRRSTMPKKMRIRKLKILTKTVRV